MPITDVSRDCDKKMSLAKEPVVYEIAIENHLAPHRLQQFEGLETTYQPNGKTTLAGPFPDQSALLGLLNWLHDLGTVLVSVRRLEETPACVFDS
jgi:hypothetical protein